MNLVLWRHADAREAGADHSDLDRPLTAKGERQAARMAEWLNHRLADSTRILVSPALRCQQTARALGRKYRTLDVLGPGAGAATLLEAARWQEAAEPVLVVGHQPTLGLAAALALSGNEQPWSVKKCAVWWLRRRGQGSEAEVLLEAVQSPDCL